MHDKNKNIFLGIVVALVMLLVIGGVVYFATRKSVLAPVAPVEQLSTSTSPAVVATTTPVAQVEVPASWRTYTNTQNGISFKYPDTFNSAFATLTSNPPKLIVTATGANIDSKGCYSGLNAAGYSPVVESNVTINNVPFCLSVGSDVGAGQLYRSYYYTTEKNGNYISIGYIVHTPNGCGAYTNPLRSSCDDFFKRYDAIVPAQLEKSVSTLVFSNGSQDHAVSAGLKNTQPTIALISPSSGPIGAKIIVSGTNFTSEPQGANLLEAVVGTTTKIVAFGYSESGSAITFYIPGWFSSCDISVNTCPDQASPSTTNKITPGTYKFRIRNPNGFSNQTSFIVTK